MTLTVGLRVQTITGRRGVIRAIEPASDGVRLVAKVRIDGDDDDLAIPLGCLVPISQMPSDTEKK